MAQRYGIQASRSVDAPSSEFTALEFFAGVGLARQGLENAGFRVIWANDIAQSKCKLYRSHFSDGHYLVDDVFNVDPSTVPHTDLAWASSPCTDLSVAGAREGLAGKESHAFFGFIRVIEQMRTRPSIIVLENVVGLVTSHQGEDLASAIRQFNVLGYSCDLLILDARRWLPQSRPRLFIVGIRDLAGLIEETRATDLRPACLQEFFSDPSLDTFQLKITAPPPLLSDGFGDLVASVEYGDPDKNHWWEEKRKDAFVESLSEVQWARVDAMMSEKTLTYRTAYRRTRQGRAVWEIRPDDISGCLRTPRGGSSRQAVVRLGHGKLDIRWMKGSEYAALMGATSYKLDTFTDNEIRFAFGDAVAVPLAQWLAENYFKLCLVPTRCH